MDVGTLIRILVKRWYVVIPVLAITLATAYQVGGSMKPVYQARGAVLLIGPNTVGEVDVNPLAELRTPLHTTALAISLVANDEQTRAEVRALGFQGVYSVEALPETPILNITVRADTPDQALLTLEAVIQAVQLELDERQRDVEAPPDSLIAGEVLTRTTTSRALYGSRDRVVAAITGLGLVAAAAAAILYNAYASRRQAMRDEAALARAGQDDEGDRIVAAPRRRRREVRREHRRRRWFRRKRATEYRGQDVLPPHIAVEADGHPNGSPRRADETDDDSVVEAR